MTDSNVKIGCAALLAGIIINVLWIALLVFIVVNVAKFVLGIK